MRRTLKTIAFSDVFVTPFSRKVYEDGNLHKLADNRFSGCNAVVFFLRLILPISVADSLAVFGDVFVLTNQYIYLLLWRRTNINTRHNTAKNIKTKFLLLVSNSSLTILPGLILRMP